MTEYKQKKAVALRYDRLQHRSPKVVATGRGGIADNIIARAKEAGVVVSQDADLVEVLSAVPLGDEIPEALYQVVAELLSFVYKMNNEYPESGHVKK